MMGCGEGKLVCDGCVQRQEQILRLMREQVYKYV
jgi:hypothetical protein